MEYQGIIYKKEEGIATITLNRPERNNSINPEMEVSIQQAIKDAAQDDEVRVLVLTATGRVFCSGADVKDMANEVDQPEPGRSRWATEIEEKPIFSLSHGFDKPTIAAINGVAAGGGLDMALACDIRIASDRAKFSEIYVRRGIIPIGGTYFLPRLVGVDKACQLIWTGDMIDAEEAERIGLVTMVVPHDELESSTLELAEKLIKGPPLAIQRAKRAIYDGLKMDLRSALENAISFTKELHETEDHREGAKAFVEKREPVFKGK